tara:strand:- start:26 stop:463 length:438 start_codon:yes stop_codon:yes gene_type:complete
MELTISASLLPVMQFFAGVLYPWPGILDGLDNEPTSCVTALTVILITKKNLPAIGAKVKPRTQSLDTFGTAWKCHTLSVKFHHGNDLHLCRMRCTIGCPRKPRDYGQTIAGPCFQVTIPFDHSYLSPCPKCTAKQPNVKLKKTFF